MRRWPALPLAATALVLPLLALGQQPTSPPSRPGTARGVDTKQPVTVDADHMEAFRKEALIIFTGNVIAQQDRSVQYADRMEVYLDEKGDRVLRTVSTGNVRIITRDCRTGTAKRAEYYDDERRVELIGNARVWEADNVVSGERITIFVNEERSVVRGGKQERVKAVFYPASDTADRPRPQAECKR